MSATLVFQGIFKTYNKQPVLENINLSVNPGEFLTFLGPSGSGKTTLLRLVGGFERPDEGQIFLKGAEISHLPPYKRRVNTVFQNYALFPHLNVSQNIAFGLQNLRVKKTDIRQQVKSALEMVQLTGYESRLPSELSGGQQQRVALARALVMQPEVLLLDEPFGALDQRLRKQMQMELKALQRKVGLTFIFVTHDQEEALSLSDRIAVLNKGSLEQVGSPQEIYDHPQTRFVADFMGMQNIFPLLSVEARGETFHCCTHSGQHVQVSKPVRQNEDFGFFAIRPTNISLLREPPGNGCANVIKGRIKECTYLGSFQHWSIAIAPNETWVVSQALSQDHSSASRFTVQDEVYLCWSRESGILLS
jgi:spermidine/putrescine transport system ATP-binding protein